ncbi:hypothetical protein OHB39_11810 [Streptomyces sp. NBC_00047]|uniref:hypothetical protein n=1 Tax=Streptomyces sp. NBC_00047 TaxID=2975627 RepID=UPI002252BBD0|nr:hypothetical protein [Streptomyces sp. NBC_00047]MCX5608247.1 hypothetical protein [Streptomyces sp. NBC_00047]
MNSDLNRWDAAEAHQPIPLQPAPLAIRQPHLLPETQTIQLPDGRLVTGYAIAPAKAPEPVAERPAISPIAVNIALGGIGFAAACGGLMLLTTFIAALAAFIQQLIILAAVIFGGFIATQVLGNNHGSTGGTVVNIRRAVFKRNHFHS